MPRRKHVIGSIIQESLSPILFQWQEPNGENRKEDLNALFAKGARYVGQIPPTYMILDVEVEEPNPY